MISQRNSARLYSLVQCVHAHARALTSLYRWWEKVYTHGGSRNLLIEIAELFTVRQRLRSLECFQSDTLKQFLVIGSIFMNLSKWWKLLFVYFVSEYDLLQIVHFSPIFETGFFTFPKIAGKSWKNRFTNRRKINAKNKKQFHVIPVYFVVHRYLPSELNSASWFSECKITRTISFILRIYILMK